MVQLKSTTDHIERRVFHFAYATVPKPGQQMEPHFIRDSPAALAVFSPFLFAGYRYGGIIPNYPAVEGYGDMRFDGWGGGGLRILTEHDVILITTRPPLDDDEENDKKHIKRSFTTLEHWVLETLRQIYVHCSKKKVVIDGVTSWWSSLKFDAHHPSDIKGWRGTTAAYLTCVKKTRLPDGRPGPAIVCVFGMAGTETMLWAHWLAENQPSLLLREGVVIARVTAPSDDAVRRTPCQDFHRYASLWNFQIQWPAPPSAQPRSLRRIDR